MNLKSIGCLLPLMTLVLMGCSTISGTVASEETVAAQSEVQADLDKEGVDQSDQTLNVESEELKEALDRMLLEFNVTISAEPEKYGLDLVDDGSLLVREGDSLSKIIQAIAGDSQINPEFLQRVFIEANPRAFKRKNPNWMYAGARLKIPDLNDFRRVLFKKSAVMDQDQNASDPRADWIRYPSISPE